MRISTSIKATAAVGALLLATACGSSDSGSTSADGVLNPPLTSRHRPHSAPPRAR